MNKAALGDPAIRVPLLSCCSCSAWMHPCNVLAKIAFIRRRIVTLETFKRCFSSVSPHVLGQGTFIVGAEGTSVAGEGPLAFCRSLVNLLVSGETLLCIRSVATCIAGEGPLSLCSSLVSLHVAGKILLGIRSVAT